MPFYFVTLDNLVSSLILQHCDPPLKKPGYSPDLNFVSCTFVFNGSCFKISSLNGG